MREAGEGGNIRLRLRRARHSPRGRSVPLMTPEQTLPLACRRVRVQRVTPLFTMAASKYREN